MLVEFCPSGEWLLSDSSHLSRAGVLGRQSRVHRLSNASLMADHDRPLPDISAAARIVAQRRIPKHTFDHALNPTYEFSLGSDVLDSMTSSVLLECNRVVASGEIMGFKFVP